MYHVTAFADDGRILTTGEGYIDVLLPEQTLGLGGELWLDEGMLVDRVEIEVKAGDFVEANSIPFFSTENVTYQATG